MAHKYNDIYRKLLYLTQNKTYSFENRLNEAYSKLIEYIKSFSNYEKMKNKNSIEYIENHCKTITNIIGTVYKGRRDLALTMLYDTFFTDEIKVHFEKIEKESTQFYRMRTSDSFHTYTEKEMFHIPFSMRSKSNNERYSISGLPSLYLGSSSYLCWEELKRPDLNYVNVASYIPKKELLVLDLTYPNANEKIDFNNLKLLPLIIASDFIVANPKDPFKPEYIIPELIMECLIRYRQEILNDDIVLGIKYKSTHSKSENLYFSATKKEYENKFYNYVFPPIEINDKEHCEKLLNAFSFEGRTTLFEIKNLGIYRKLDRTAKTDYENSSFFEIEDYLRRCRMLSYSSLTGAQTY